MGPGEWERSHELDPDFVGAAFWLAGAYFWTGDDERAGQMIEKASRNQAQLTPHERLLVQVGEAGILTRNYGEALKCAREASDLAPGSATVEYFVALAALWTNRPQEVLEVSERLDPRLLPTRVMRLWTFRTRARALYILGRLERLLEEARRARDDFPDRWEPIHFEVRALAALGRLEDVNRLIQESLALQLRSLSPADLMRSASMELRATGRNEASKELAERAVRWLDDDASEGSESRRSDLAAALSLAERWQEARELYEALAAEDPKNWRLRGQIGCLAARFGDVEAALAESRHLTSITDAVQFPGRSSYHGACIATIRGEREKAMSLLHQAIEEGFRGFEGLHRDPNIETLRGYPPFDELLRPKG